jgi:hypothetical protein
MNEDKVTTAHLDAVTEQLGVRMDAGFAGVHARMGRFEDEVRPVLLENTRKIAVLEYQASEAKRASEAATTHVVRSKQSTRNRATAWGTGAGAAAYFIVELVKVIKPLVLGH